MLNVDVDIPFCTIKQNLVLAFVELFFLILLLIRYIALSVCHLVLPSLYLLTCIAFCSSRLKLKICFETLTRPFGICYEFNKNIRTSGKYFLITSLIANDADYRVMGWFTVVYSDYISSVETAEKLVLKYKIRTSSYRCIFIAYYVLTWFI